MNIGEMQRKLSLWAEQDEEHRFFDLYHLLYDSDWLRLAHDYVKQNAGSITAGCNGIDMSLFDENLEANLQKIAQELKSETFEPHPVRRVYIPKTNGKVRPLGIPSIRDRIVQEALRMILEPIYEADFTQNSFGFRPNRCTMDAVKYAAMNTIGHQRYYWIIEGDISSCFDTINHRKLIKIIRQRIQDKKILRLIWKFLRAGVMEGKLFRDTKQGTPQGGIISPLLANIYLDKLDEYMSRHVDFPDHIRHRRRKQGLANYLYARYADDFIVLCNGTKSEAEAMKEELYQFLTTGLKLKLSKEKTKVTHLNDGFKFLGFWIQRCPAETGMKTKILIPKEAVDKITAKIRQSTSPNSHQDSVVTKIQALNRIIRGWCQYYQYTSGANHVFSKLSHRLYWSMAHWLGRKYKASIPEIIKRYGKNNSFAINQETLLMPKEFKTKIYKASVRKPNPYTQQTITLRREFLPQESYWTGYERRPGAADLKLLALKRDNYVCQMCDKAVSVETSHADHIKPVRRFKRPVDANRLENIWTLCINCHNEKTEIDRQMESRMH
jgi:RNA-directed DNA polymerase